ncbi:hypothetical protein PCC7418_0029 [Halothece sp. PCC 7418]|uniref:DUF2357 domain-containing protein n=1 Tax=Halothece sp. (strain PCC 7418) TaxID=65093 RepID=UPI0002A06450|nr:DUF2357 domain-containing protein [Halothece sp. PCC 7418]AFZ42287.1 hypothetical protein PCC7418_0029 [Halothece sp. PCC 7418]
MQYLNRITGTKQATPPQSFLLGQWQILTENSALTLNQIPLSKQSQFYLVGNQNHRLNLRGNNQTEDFQITLPRWQISEELIADSIRSFHSQRKSLEEQESSLDQWRKIPPLIPEIQDRIKLQPLTQEIADKLKHLEEICRRPRTYLKMETERLPVSRAKRISKHAVSFLSAHPEDWERVKMHTVIPKNILSLVREELLDIYENRVTVRLIDHLLDYINCRIQEVKAIKQELDEANNFSADVENIFYLNSRRVCTLWGDYFDTDIGEIEAEETLKKLQSLQYKLRGLISTPVYQAIPQQAHISGTLKRTNILVHDQHYRHVDQLWRKWSHWKSQKKKTPQQFFQESQDFCEGFESFCLLLITRALMGNNTSDDKGFSFQSVADTIPQKNSQPFQFTGLFGSITLTWNKDGTFLLTDETQKNRPLKIIPMISQLKTSESEQFIQTIESQIEKQIELTNRDFPYCLILYPGVAEDRHQLSSDLQKRIYTLGNQTFPNQSLVGFLPVTPLDIFSVERVARGIQWWLNGQRYQVYPPLISLPYPLDNSLKSILRCLQPTNTSQNFRVIQFSTPAEKQDYQRELERMINQYRSQGRSQKGKVQRLETIKEMALLEQVEEELTYLIVCPVCHDSDNKSNFQSLETGCFSCCCNKCNSQWGTKMSNELNQKYPYIDVNHNSTISSPEEIDRTVGRDILNYNF